MFIILYYYQFYFILYPLPSLMGGVGGEAFSIFNLLQEQSSCRHTIAGLATVLLFYHLAEAVDVERSAPHFHERTHDGSHHITQETVGGDLEIFVLVSVFSFEKLVKSSYSISVAAARFIASKSGVLTKRHERSRRKGDLRV